MRRSVFIRYRKISYCVSRYLQVIECPSNILTSVWHRDYYFVFFGILYFMILHYMAKVCKLPSSDCTIYVQVFKKFRTQQKRVRIFVFCYEMIIITSYFWLNLYWLVHITCRMNNCFKNLHFKTQYKPVPHSCKFSTYNIFISTRFWFNVWTNNCTMCDLLNNLSQLNTEYILSLKSFTYVHNVHHICIILLFLIH